jgi:hypothetical protein
MHDTCGALLGGSLMLGLQYGRAREEIEDVEKTRSAGERVGQLYQWFENEFGSTRCRDIRTKFGGGVFYDMSIPEQAEAAHAAGIGDKCADLTGKTAARTVEMLWDSMVEDL